MIRWEHFKMKSSRAFLLWNTLSSSLKNITRTRSTRSNFYSWVASWGTLWINCLLELFILVRRAWTKTQKNLSIRWILWEIKSGFKWINPNSFSKFLASKHQEKKEASMKKMPMSKLQITSKRSSSNSLNTRKTKPMLQTHKWVLMNSVTSELGKC